MARIAMIDMNWCVPDMEYEISKYGLTVLVRAFVGHLRGKNLKMKAQIRIDKRANVKKM